MKIPETIINGNIGTILPLVSMLTFLKLYTLTKLFEANLYPTIITIACICGSLPNVYTQCAIENDNDEII